MIVNSKGEIRYLNPKETWYVIERLRKEVESLAHNITNHRCEQ